MIRPCWGFHKWGTWWHARDVNVYLDSPFDDDTFVETEREQERDCQRCGLTEVRVM